MSSHSSSNPGTLSYEQAGVNYDLIDPLKVAAQRAAAATATHLSGHGFTEVAASRGESAYVVDVGPFYLASIVECLGSKALVADEMAELTGRSYYDGIAQDTIAMAVNDLITVGATPLVVQAYWAASVNSDPSTPCRSISRAATSRGGRRRSQRRQAYSPRWPT
jgi:phosphoribosylformylglycinamidine cyclo-ligase